MARKNGVSWSDIAGTKVGKLNAGKIAQLWPDKTAKRSKYNNKKVIIDGIEFDSIGEGDRYKQLRGYENENRISNLRLQVVYPLVDKNIKSDGTKVHAMNYKADFVYFNNETGKEVVEDFKGKRTRTYIDKAKIMLARHKIEIYETNIKHVKGWIL